MAKKPRKKYRSDYAHPFGRPRSITVWDRPGRVLSKTLDGKEFTYVMWCEAECRRINRDNPNTVEVGQYKALASGHSVDLVAVVPIEIPEKPDKGLQFKGIHKEAIKGVRGIVKTGLEIVNNAIKHAKTKG